MSNIKLDDLLYETDAEDLDNFLNEANLEEGPFGNAWGAVKSLVAKGGSLEKGGKLFGRGKASKEMIAKYDAALEKAGAAALKDLDAKLKEKFPNFPNMGNKEAKAFSKEIYDELGGSKAATAMFMGLWDARTRDVSRRGVMTLRVVTSPCKIMRRPLGHSLRSDFWPVEK